MTCAFKLFRGLDVRTTFAQSMSYQFQMGLSVSKILWSVPRTDIQAPEPSHMLGREHILSQCLNPESLTVVLTTRCHSAIAGAHIRPSLQHVHLEQVSPLPNGLDIEPNIQ